MALDDLPLDRPASPQGSGRIRPPEPPARSPKGWIILGASAVGVVALLAFWWMSRSQPKPAPPAPTQATDVAVGSNRPKRQPMALPPLSTSDALLRDLVGGLSRHPLLARFLATDSIVRTSVLAVEQIGEGRTPASALKVFRPDSRLAIVGAETGNVDPRTYTRWNAPTQSLASINPQQAAQLYVNVKPLFDEAYRELGHPTGDFDESILRAMEILRETPEITREPELIRRPGYYEHGDPALRSLRPVQKQLLLTGPENRRRILDWLGRFAKALDLNTQ
jgi:hypothetical protein